MLTTSLKESLISRYPAFLPSDKTLERSKDLKQELQNQNYAHALTNYYNLLPLQEKEREHLITICRIKVKRSSISLMTEAPTESGRRQTKGVRCTATFKRSTFFNADSSISACKNSGILHKDHKANTFSLSFSLSRKALQR